MSDDPLVPAQKNIKEGSRSEEKARLSFEELKGKLDKEKEGVGSLKMPTSVPESDAIRSGSEGE